MYHIQMNEIKEERVQTKTVDAYSKFASIKDLLKKSNRIYQSISEEGNKFDLENPNDFFFTEVEDLKFQDISWQ